jgi:hypothetical protein
MSSRGRTSRRRAPASSSSRVGGAIGSNDVLLLWRALLHFRSGRHPACAPTPKGSTSRCPLFLTCSRWASPPGSRGDSEGFLDLDEQDAWACARLLDLLDPDVSWLGPRQRRST